MTAAFPPSPASGDHAQDRETLDLAPPGQGAGQRADAVRNRARLLEAAACLVAEHGAANLTMDAVAAAASVGKGTVFRRFGDRTGLMLALLDHAEQQFQAAFLTGPAPLGPGADTVQRLQAFGPAALRHENAHLDLYLAAEPKPARRFTNPARSVRLTHVAMLLRQADAGADTDLLAQTLLGYLDTALVHHLLTQRGMSLERLEAGWSDLVTRLTTGGRSAGNSGKD